MPEGLVGPATLVCGCGKRLKATGATLGRVGRCPACGAMLRVSEDNLDAPPTKKNAPRDEESPAGYGVLPPTAERAPTFVSTRPAAGAPELPPNLARDDRRGLVLTPKELETRLRDSLLYPLWDVGGVGLMAIMPLFLTFTSIFSFGMLPTYVLGFGQGEVVAMGALIVIFPLFCLFALVMGRTMTYLEQVLISSSHGDIAHPRWPNWDFFGLVGIWFRWLIPLAIGYVVPGFLALVYWLHAGDFGLADWVIFLSLMLAGSVYGLMGLVASILHADLRAANPFMVFGALRRVGLRYLAVCLLVGGAATASILGALGLFELSGTWLPLVATWLFWVAFLYLAMAVLRIVGVFYRRHAPALGWFPERPRWGG